MKAFRFHQPNEVYFGSGCLEKLPTILRGKKKALIVADPIMQQLGALDTITGILDDAGIAVSLFLKVENNPSMENVDAGVAQVQAEGCDAVVSLGGGSAIDTAKGIACVSRNGGKCADYEGFKKEVSIQPLLHIAIPTTAGTGSEVTPFACLTNPYTKYKWHIVSDRILPNAALLDPSMITSMPAWLAAATGMDALTHAMEAYMSLESTPYSDIMAEKAISLIGQNLRAFVANRQDEEAAGNMLLGSTLAGIAFAWAATTAVHALTGTIGGQFGMHHGTACAVLLPLVLDFNALADKGRYRTMMQLLQPEKDLSGFEPSDLSAYVAKLRGELGLPSDFKSYVCSEACAAEISRCARSEYSARVNPRVLTDRDVRAILEKIFTMQEK